MFSGSNAKEIEVSIRMLDEAVIRGILVMSQSTTSLDGILAKDTPFLEFISKNGQRKFISKHQIAYVEPVEPLRKPVIKGPNDPRYVDAFTILGLRQPCTLQDAKMAYHALAKTYHPDNYSGMDLPEEVSAYLSDMFKQINTAFTEVRSELDQAA